MIACPECGHEDTRVREVRNTKPDQARRRLACAKCKHRFTTIEVIVANPRAVSADPVLVSRSAVEELARAIEVSSDED